MNARFKKELHPLVLPWVTALAGAVLVLVLSQEPNPGQFAAFLAAAGGFAFLGGVALVGSSAFGIELQHRTLSLLLTQPSDRARIWREKMLASGLAILSAALIGGAVHLVLSVVQSYPAPSPPHQDLAIIALFLLATTCSCGFWTLAAGSIIGGVVFTIAAQFGFGLIAVFLGARLLGRELEEREAFTVLAATALVYSVVFLWLGRRQFIHFELKSGRFGESAPTVGAWFINPPRLLMSRARGWLGNLVRKELRLQKTLLQMAVVFVGCWLATFLFQWFRPKQPITYLFDTITCVYAPLCSLLAGCLSLGEEKALGLTVSQLTLPLSSGVQWLIKLVVSFATAVVLCLVLPACLFWVTGQLLDLSASGLMNPQDNGLRSLGCICGAVFLMGFWAISLSSSTVKAAVVAVFGLIVAGGCVALGVGLGQNSSLSPLVALMCHLQKPPDDFVEAATHFSRAFVFCSMGGIVLLCLLQSFFQFRNTQAPLKKVLLYTFSLCSLISFLSFWSTDLFSSTVQLPVCGPVQELKSALEVVVTRNSREDREQSQRVATNELGMLSPLTAIWLRHAVISYRLLPPTAFKNGYIQSNFQATVVFPNGRTFQFEGGRTLYPIPRR